MATQIFESMLRAWIFGLGVRMLADFGARLCGVLLFSFAGPIGAQAPNTFPETGPLIQRVVQHQKEVESLLNTYTFTDKQTVYMLDKKGQVRSQHTDTYYITPTPYESFVIHVAHDGKPVPEPDLKKQESAIDRKLREYEKKAEKPGGAHPKNNLLFADIVEKSQFTPLRWDQLDGKAVVVYSFEPKATPRGKGDLNTRVAEDLKGNMWISSGDAEILRVDFANVSPLTFGYGFLGNAKTFFGYVEQCKVHDEVWLPLHQEFVAEGRQLVQGYRMRQVDDFSEYLKATTDVFQQIHTPNPNADGNAGSPR